MPADSRQQRLQDAGLRLRFNGQAALPVALASDRLIIAVVASRLGHDPNLHRDVSQQLTASMQDLRQSNGLLLVAKQTAIEPWAIHAAKTFGVECIRLAIDEDKSNPATDLPTESASSWLQILVGNAHQEDGKLNRDQVVVALADRVDAVHVRHGGTIERLLMDRAKQHPASVRVAIPESRSNHAAISQLLASGAVGRYLPAHPATSGENSPCDIHDDERFTCELPTGDWLVHCTRAASGPWPGQTWSQYRDDLLLSDPAAASRDAIDALCRIIRMQRLIGNRIATKNTDRVVCFSAVRLDELLARRTYRSHLHRWDYEPYGIMIERSAAQSLGVVPVIYGEETDFNGLSENDRFRFQAKGQTYDWTAEQEWRCRGDLDLSQLTAEAIRVFTPDVAKARHVANTTTVGWETLVTSEAT